MRLRLTSRPRYADAAALSVLVCVLGCRAPAQTCQPGELRVIVKDTDEGAIYEAQVRLGSDATEVGQLTTSTAGIADFEHVPCGDWTARADKGGFEEGSNVVHMTSAANLEVTVVLKPSIVHASVEVSEKIPLVEESSSEQNELRPMEVKTLPTNPVTVSETLPLIPGVVRSPDGELKIDATGEERSALVVNQSDQTDPATGKFGQTIPVDSIETVNVLNTPFLAQYGRFTQSVVAVETRRGGEKWHADLNDPFPDFRIRSYHFRGIRNETPRAVLGGPLIPNRLYFISSLVYILDKVPSRTLGFPYNESKQESLNSFTQIDYIVSPKQIINATMHVSPQHTNFVNPEYFNPQPVTPTYAQHNYVGTAADHYGLFGGTLDSSISVQRFEAYVGAQGDAGMVLTPEGNRGNYFGTQNRYAKRTEWLEIWSPGPLKLMGSHLIKLGSSLTESSDQGRFTYRPADVLNTNGQRLENISFTHPGSFNRADLEETAYVQDHWILTPRLALDFGGRVEHQKLASSLRLAPRVGMSWTPWGGERTVLRGGFGQFYDHIPLDVYAFSRYPNRTLTYFGPDGSVLGSPIPYVNVIGSVTGPRSFLISGRRVAGSFSPRGLTWNVQAEHSFSRLVRVRATLMDNHSVGLIVLDPELLGTTNEIVLDGSGSSRYRQAEITAKLGWDDGKQLVFSYTRSRAEGDLNGFDTFLGNFGMPIVRPDMYARLPADLPNRFLLWGHTSVPFWSLQLLPTVEYRNGFPYAALDALQEYSGIPYRESTRFPNFFSADARVMRDFKLNPKYTVRLSVTGFNVTNHFNALAVHSNVTDPQYGVFFGNYHRRYRFDFEVIF